MNTLTIILLLLGVLIIATVLALAVKIPNPSTTQFFTFRVVTALGAACLASIIPGVINIDAKIGEIVVTAAGAIAMFVLVYLMNPPETVKGLMKPTT